MAYSATCRIVFFIYLFICFIYTGWTYPITHAEQNIAANAAGSSYGPVYKKYKNSSIQFNMEVEITSKQSRKEVN